MKQRMDGQVKKLRSVGNPKNIKSYRQSQQATKLVSLRNILRIWWPKSISNKELWETTQPIPISSEIKIRKWKLIGHALRKYQNTPTSLERDLIRIHKENERRVDQELHGIEESLRKYNSKMCPGKTQNKWQNIQSAVEHF
jgi:hypothetical protein